MSNLKTLSSYLTKNKLWKKSFQDITKEKMIEIQETITNPNEEFSPPFLRKIKRHGKDEHDLVIPSNAPFKYRHWQGGQSPKMTVIELGADRETIEKYSHKEGTKH
jgi:hypothetical protein